MKRIVQFSLALSMALALSSALIGCTSSDEKSGEGPPIGPGKTDMVKKPDAGGTDASMADADTAKDPADAGDIPEEAFAEMLSFDRERLRMQTLTHEELFLKLHNYLPKEMIFERELLISRL